MAKPIVAIIGRPNVGKSTLFNRIIGSFRRRQEGAIVEKIEGVTRDRNYADAEWEGRAFIVVDTGGFYPGSKEEIFSEVKEQAMYAASEANLIIHLLDAKDGLTPADESIADMLRASGKKTIWAVNKIDTPTRESLLYDFYRLEAEDIYPLSAATGYMFDEFMEKVVSYLPEAVPEPEVELPRVAVVGRPNVGKSTLVNQLLGKKRLVVSSVGGTTRDAIDAICTYYGRKYLFIDTAGIRRKARAYSLERFGMVRTLRSIERSDVALIVLDASEGILAEDQKIAGLVQEHGKGAVFLLNKWDLVKDPENALKRLRGELRRKIWFFEHAPFVTTSGLEKKRITKIFDLIDGVLAERKKTIPQDEIKVLLDEALPEIRIPRYQGRKIHIAGLKQVGKEPPVFALYVSEPAGLKDAYLKYFEKRLRDRYSFSGTPVKIVKKRKR
jgi:GTP-binding protein